MAPTPHSNSAFPYTVPYTNPYTQRKTQSTPLPSSQSSQQKLEHALSILVRSSNVPSTQNIEHLCGLVERATDFIGGSPRNTQHRSSSSCWSLSMAESLAKFVVRIFGKQETINMTGRNPEGYPSTLCFLARSLDQWSFDDSIMFAVVEKEFEVELDHQMCLRDVLHNLSVQYDDPTIQKPALMGLSIIWRYLERIQFLTSWKNPSEFPNFSLDSAWWIRDEEALSGLALKGLLSKENEEGYPKADVFPSEEELKISRISTLVSLLRHDRDSWLFQFASQNKESLQRMSQQLMETIRKLNDPELASRLSLHYTIACASLLILMDQKEALEPPNEIQQLIKSTRMLDSVFHSAFGVFGANSSSGPRWTFEHRDAGTLRWMEKFIFIWSICQPGETRQFTLDNLERHWKPHIEQCWRSLLTEDYGNPADAHRKLKHCKELLSRMNLLYSIHHDSLQSSLLSFMTQLSHNSRESAHYLVQPCQSILKTLQHLCFNPDTSVALCGASLMKSLLSERGSVAAHNDIFVRAMDFGMLKGLIQGVIELAKSGTRSEDPVFRPMLLSLLDIIDLTLSWEPALKAVNHLVDAESLEVLIFIMTPKDIRIDQAGAFLNASQNTTMMEDFDTDTPPANNLSRLDEKSICIEKEEEEKATTGIDHAIRLAVATVLSRLGYTDIDNIREHREQDRGAGDSRDSEVGLRLLQSRIRTSVTDFLSASTSDHCGEHSADGASRSLDCLASSSMETTRRRFRLLVSMAVPENEDFLASFLFAKDKSHQHVVEVLQESIVLSKKKLEKAAQKEAELILEKEECRKKMDAQSVRFWREGQRLKKTNAEATKSKVAQYDAERKIAERRVVAINKQLREAEARVSEADRAAKSSHEAEARLRLELDDAAKKTRALEEANQELKRQFEQKNAAAFEMQEKLANLEENKGKLKRMLADKDGTIADVQEARDNMESNLDSLFADLVNLTNMYEVEETKTEGLRAQNDTLSRELQDARRQKEDFERALRSQNGQLQSEKERLENRLAKYKDKVEKMRKEREEREQQRKIRNPVGHINALHDSMNTSAHTSWHGRSSASQKRSSSSKAHSSRGKENSYASESQRRSRTRDEHSSSSAFRQRSHR